MRFLPWPCRCFLFLPILLLKLNAHAQANLPIYTGYLVNGFQNWSWADVDLTNNAYAYANNNSISVTNTAGYQALYLSHINFNISPYNTLDFWINGGLIGGQKLQVGGVLNGTNYTTLSLGILQTNVWQHFSFSLSSLGIANATNFSGFWIQSSVGNPQPVFYVDAIQLLAAPAPAIVHLKADAANVFRTTDTRWFGLNTAVWDGEFDTAANSTSLKEIGCTTFRFPGGSLSDEYHWATGISGTNQYVWATSFTDFIQVATNLGAQVFITANYGTGTSNEAAAWVACANITNHCNFKYWEIGNEVYGSWEADSNALPHDPVTYATRAAGYIQLMKAMDPTIKIGAVAVPGEDSSTNYLTEIVTNPITGQTHSGWTPVMLTTFKKMGIYPDFLIYHFYPQYTSGGINSSDSDPLLLQVAGNPNPNGWTDWASAAANLRQQLTNYLGAPGTNIELCVTENNSDAGTEGKQSTSIVNGLYLADSLGQLMKTEFNSLIWWDLRNGPDTNGDFDSTLYGWRTYGDLGIIEGTANTSPVYYSEKLLQYFTRAGDSVLNASSDYLLLSAYAVHRTNGALTMLVINKDLTTYFNAQIVLTNFMPAPNAFIQSYGITQDEATRTNAAMSLHDISSNTFAGANTNFTYSFPPGSMTLFTFAPAAVTLQSSLVPTNKFVLQYQGQSGVPYVIQASPNLANWNSVLTNSSTNPISNITNMISSMDQFWRVIWHP
jgi:alpha-N-arabinofuranosidase